jgi:hypothetical protein
MAEKTSSVEAQCDACGGTGVYCGMAEPKGVGVVCHTCGGSAKMTIAYTPFTGRKRREGVTTVQVSRGMSIIGCGPSGSSVTYEEFLAGKLPRAK